MIALLYNDNNGGMHEFEFRLANSTEVQLGLKYMASRESIFVKSSVLSPGAYSPDGLTVLYLDQMSPDLPIRYHSSFVTASSIQPYGGTSYNPGGMRVAFAGYGPGQKLLYALYRRRRLPVSVQMGLFLSFTRWYLYLGGKVLTSTAGFFPVHAPGVKRIFFIESGDDDTVRSTDEAGGDGSVVARFEGGLIRALAVTQNRSRAAGERVQSGDELIVSVHYPQEGQSAVYTGIGSGKATAFKKRFSTPGDWVMVAGTGAFGGGTRIVFNLGYNLRVWDNRDGSMNEIRQWKRVDDTHSVHEPIPGFRHYVWGSGLALSPNVEPK